MSIIVEGKLDLDDVEDSSDDENSQVVENELDNELQGHGLDDDANSDEEELEVFGGSAAGRPNPAGMDIACFF